MRLRFLCAATAVALGLAAPAGAANLITNAGFEDADLSAWQAFAGAATLTRTTTEAHQGGAALLVHERTQSYGGPSQDLTGRLVAGTRYIVSVWVKMATDEATRPSLNIKSVIGGSTTYTTVASLPTDHTRWVKLSGVYQYDPAGTPGEVRVYVQGPAATLDFYVDDFEVEAFPQYVVTPSTPADFVRRSGAGLVVGPADTPIRLRGVNFGAYGEEGDSTEAVLNGQEVDPEVDYARVAALGGNVVRLNSWWKVFENASAPYTYSEDGWAWLERQIVAARAAGVRLVLDMHAPQGGYQGPGYTGSYWSSPSLQARHKALLVALADRYKNEPWIAAFDVMNEPCPPSDADWQAVAADAVAAIRAVDTNHLVIVEQSMASDSAAFTLPDPDLLYEFHWYERWRWVSQLSYPSAVGDYGIAYPDADVTVPPWDQVAGSLQKIAPAAAGSGDWTYLVGTPFTLADTAVFGAVPVAWATSMSGKLWFDDMVVEEVDSGGNVVRTLSSIDIERKPSDWWTVTEYEPFHSFTSDWSGAALSGSGSWGVENSGHRGAASASIRGASGTYTVGNEKNLVALAQGHRYRVSGWIKTDAMTGSGGLGLRLYQYASWDGFTPFTKDHLAGELRAEGMDFYEAAGAAVNIGEIGISPRNLLSGRGGDQWLLDMFDLLAGYGASYQYFDWHSSNFGAYTNSFGLPEPAGANQPLLDLLAGEWGGPGIQNLIAIAGRDQVVRVAGDVALDGSSSVGTVDTWNWQQNSGPAVTLLNADTPAPSFVAPPVPGTLTFRLTVNGPGGTSEDLVDVDVIEPCPATLDTASCLDAYGAVLSVDERHAGKEKLQANWKGIAEVTTREDFGNPVTGTSRYSLCLYADATLAGEMFVDRAGDRCAGASCWNYAGSGWNYKDNSAAAGGIRQLRIKPGAAGKGSVKVLGKNNAAKGSTSLPVGVAAPLSAAAEVAVQLRVDDGLCLSSTLTWAKTKEPARYAGGK